MLVQSSAFGFLITVDDDRIAVLKAIGDDPELTDFLARRDFAVLCLAIAVDDGDVIFTQRLLNGALRYGQRIALDLGIGNDRRIEAREADKIRKNYYNFYAKKTWADKASYEMLIDSSRISEKELAAMLRALLTARGVELETDGFDQ